MNKAILPDCLSTLIEKLKKLRANPRFSKMLSIFSVIYPLALIYLSRKEILSLEWGSFFGVLLTSLLVYYISMSLQNVAWSLIVDSNLSQFWLNSQVYYETVLMKRIPGGIWHWLGRLSIYEVNSPEKSSVVSKSNFSEWLILILTGLVGYTLTSSPSIGAISLILTIAITTWLLSKDEESLIKTFFLALGIVFFYLVCWLAGGLILHYLLTVAQPNSLIPFKTSIATWCLSSAISMLLFFFPSGSIIRDFSLAALLANLVEPAKVVLVILQIRVIFLVADFLWSFLSLQFIKLMKPKNVPKAN